jgi:hypothetical protein
VLSRTLRVVAACMAATSLWLPASYPCSQIRGPGDTTPPAAPPPPPPAAPSGESGLPGATGGTGASGGHHGANPSGGSSGSGFVPEGSASSGLPSTFGAGGASTAAWEWWWRMHGESLLPPLRSRTGLDDGLEVLELDRAARELALPALLEAVRDAKSSEVLASGMIALATLGSLATSRSEVRELIEPRLADPHRQVAETAAVALGLLGDRAAFDVLRAAMLGDAEGLRARGIAVGNVPERMRAFAAYGLGLLGDRGVSHVERSLLVAALAACVDQDAAPEARAELATACIVALSMVPLPMDARRSEPSVGRPERVDSLDAQILWLVHRLGDRSVPYPARAQVPTAIARLAAATPERHWLRSLAIRECAARIAERADEPYEVRVGCVLALGLLGDAGGDTDSAAARRALTQTVLGRSDPTLVGLALISLGRASSRPGAGESPWQALLEESGPRQVLSEIVRDGRSVDRPMAAIGLALLERGAAERGGPASAQSLEDLREAFEDSRSPESLSALAVALGLARNSSAAPAIRAEISRTSEPAARGYLALSLGILGDSSSIPTLEKLLRRARFHPGLVDSASRGLALLEAPNLEPLLADQLSEAGSRTSKSVIARALANVGGKGSIPALLAEIGRERLPDAARASAIAALGRICEPRERPWISDVSRSVNYIGAAATLLSPATGDGLLDLR